MHLVSEVLWYMWQLTSSCLVQVMVTSGIILASVDTYICNHMASVSCNGLMLIMYCYAVEPPYQNCIWYCNIVCRIQIRIWTHKRHIAHPHGWAIEWLLWLLLEKIYNVKKLLKIFTGPMYELLFSFMGISNVYRSFIPNETTFTK